MKKIIMIGAVVLVLAGGIYAWWFFTNLTTFNEAFNNKIASEETVEEVSAYTIPSNEIALSQEESQEFFNEFREVSEEITLREIDPSPRIDYVVTINTDQNRYTMYISEHDISIDDGTMTHYRVHSDNPALEFIDEYPFDFE